MQMAMVASAIANDGVLETPYFVEGVYNSKGERSFTASAKAYGTVMSKQTADSITDMMIGVVENGTGYEAAINGVEVAGKTGTAETNKEYNDSWIRGLRARRQSQRRSGRCRSRKVSTATTRLDWQVPAPKKCLNRRFKCRGCSK